MTRSDNLIIFYLNLMFDETS